MNIEILTQPTLNNGKPFILGDEITKLLSRKKPKTKAVYFMFSLIKSNAIDNLKPFLKEFIDDGGIVNFYIDSDKRFLSNPLVPELINLGCNIYTYINPNSASEFQYRGIIFESFKSSDVYLTSGNLSLNGLYSSHNIITHIFYDISKEKKEYENFKNDIFNSNLSDYFVKLSVEMLPTILDEIRKNTSIPTISDFTKADLSITKEVDLSEPNISIEIDDSVDFLIPVETPVKPKETNKTTVIEETAVKPSNTEYESIIEYSSDTIYYGADEAIDVENLLFESKMKSVINSTAKPMKTNAFSSDKFISEEEISAESNIEEETISITKAKDLSKTSIFMFQAPKITHKGICAGEIKIPTYIRDLISHFWDWPNLYNVVGEQAKIKSRLCTFKIIDTIKPETTLEDEKTKLFQRVDESSFTIYSSVLEELNIEENDIIRLIKVSTENDSYYTCEVIRKDAKEYPIWEQFCTQTFRSSSRKYGIM